MAERIRRERGGAALVFGALSPRTRNAQVGLYQAGDVDHLVATDAIGMGLNLDIDHVVFTGLGKFDGVGSRALTPAEVGQIAGRAGRHVRDGHFGPTAELGPLDRRLVDAVESHRFAPLRSIQWRNDDLDFFSPLALLASLEKRPAAVVLHQDAPRRRPPCPRPAGPRQRHHGARPGVQSGGAPLGGLPGAGLPERDERGPRPAPGPGLRLPAQPLRANRRGLSRPAT